MELGFNEGYSYYNQIENETNKDSFEDVVNMGIADLSTNTNFKLKLDDLRRRLCLVEGAQNIELFSNLMETITETVNTYNDLIGNLKEYDQQSLHLITELHRNMYKALIEAKQKLANER